MQGYRGPQLREGIWMNLRGWCFMGVCALRKKKKIDGCWVRSGLGLCLPPFPMLLFLLCPFQLDPTVELGL